MIRTLLSNSIGIVTQKNGFDKLLSQILKKILTIAFLIAQNVQKIQKPRRVVGAVYIGKSVFFLCEVVDFFDERQSTPKVFARQSSFTSSATSRRV